MNKLFLKILYFTVPVLLVAYLLEVFITNQLEKGKRYYFQADWFDLKNHNADILFIGNSRTWVQIDPFKIQNQFGINCEILAQDGQDIQLMWLKFQQYIKVNKAPKEIYIQFDPYFLNKRNDLYGFENFCTGFYHNRLPFDSLYSRKGYSSLYKNKPLHAIDLHLLAKVILNKTVPINESYEKTHGFMKIQMNWSGNWQKPDSTRINPADFSNYIDSFFDYCKWKKISLYTMYPPQSYPSFRGLINYNKLVDKEKELKNKYDYDVTFLNFNSEKLYNDSTLFYNHLHLNNRGVDIFMVDFLKEKNAFKSFRKKQ